jgi:hypothetical protein
MIIIRKDLVTLALPQFKIDLQAAVQEITSFIKQYFHEAGPIFVDLIRSAAEDSVEHLPAEWADNFNNSLRHFVTQTGQYVIDLLIQSDYIPGRNSEYLQYMIMEVGSSGIHRGPLGRIVWDDDRLAGGQHASQSHSTSSIPQFDHVGDHFFEETIKKYETQFFNGLTSKLSTLFASGFFLRHVVVT